MVQDANQRWDNLQKRVVSILRRLKVQILSQLSFCGNLILGFLYLLDADFFFLSFHNVQHFISQREEFETARDAILVWLTEMDLQLTNIEHFSECDIQAKIKQLRVGLTSSVFFMLSLLTGLFLVLDELTHVYKGHAPLRS